MNSKQSPIETIYNKIIKAKRIPKIKSSLHNTIHLSKQLQIQISPITTTKENTPHWVINDRSFNTSLHYTTKANTPPIIYQHKFREYKNTMKDRIFLFTDGSKLSDGASYSVTTEKEIISCQIIPEYTSVFTTELAAILAACNHASKKRGKYIVCTDSLSSLKAIQNVNYHNHYTNSIRKIINKYKTDKLILLWVPGHCGIVGNELADNTAKNTHNFPSIFENNYNTSDINNFIKHSTQQYFN